MMSALAWSGGVSLRLTAFALVTMAVASLAFCDVIFTVAVISSNAAAVCSRLLAWAERANERLDLTAKEFQLLSVLARRHGDILSKAAITELVWDVNFESQANVVETAMKRLRAKLDGPFRTKMPHTVRGMGYCLSDEVET